MHALLASLLVLPAALAQDVYGADVKPTTTSTPDVPENISELPVPNGYASWNGSSPEPECTAETTVTVTVINTEETTDLPGHLYTPWSTTEVPPEVTTSPPETEETTSCDEDSTTSTPTETPSDEPCSCGDEPTTFETTVSPPIVTGTGTGTGGLTYTNSTNGTYNSPTPPVVTNTEVEPSPTDNATVTVPNGPSPTTTGDPLFTDAATSLQRWSSAGLVAAIVGVVFVGL